MKHPVLTLAFFLLHVYGLMGQSSQKFSFGLVAGPNYSYRLAQHTGGGLSDPFAEEEKGKIGYSFGATVSRCLSDLLELRSGLQLSNMGYRLPKREFTFGSCNDGNGGVDPNCDDWYKARYDYLFVDLPLEMRFKFSAIGLFLQPGLNASFLLKGRVKSTLKENGNKNSGFNDIQFRSGDDSRFFLGFNIGLGKAWRSQKLGQLALRANFRFHPRAFKYDFFTERSLYAAGLTLEKDF